MSTDELLVKFRSNADGVVPVASIDRVIDAVLNLEKVRNVGTVMAQLSTPTATHRPARKMNRVLLQHFLEPNPHNHPALATPRESAGGPKMKCVLECPAHGLNFAWPGSYSPCNDARAGKRSPSTSTSKRLWATSSVVSSRGNAT